MVQQISVDQWVEGSYEKGLEALALLREWRTVLETRLPDGTMEELERNLISLRALMSEGALRTENRASAAADEIDRAVRRIQGAGLLYFRNQPGVANRFAALWISGV